MFMGFQRSLSQGAVVVGRFGFVAAFGGEGFEVVTSQSHFHGVFEEEGIELPGEMPSETGSKG